MSDNIVMPILIAIENLAKNPRPQGYKKLKGRAGYRIRVGNYRIIYEIFDEILLIDVIHLGHRKDRNYRIIYEIFDEILLIDVIHLGHRKDIYE